MRDVVETNVCIAANGRNTHASMACQLACIDYLQQLASTKSRDNVLLDKAGLIMGEYDSYLNYRGQPGTGDMFFKFLHDHMYSSNRIERISVLAIDDDARGFEELPANPIDKSDRKFLAVAIKGDGRIVNAMDSDWHEQASFVAQQGVAVTQICPEHGCPLLTA